MLSARNIENSKIVFDDFRRIAREDFAREHGRTRVSPGDVLLTIVGTIGRAAVVPALPEPFTLQRSVAVLSAPGLDPKFIVYQLQSPRVQQWLRERAAGTAQKGVYLKTLGELPIAIAPKGEQRRIVAALEEHLTDLDAASAGLAHARANLDRYRAAVLDAAFTGRLCRDVTNAPVAQWSNSSLAAIKKFSVYGPRFSSDAYSSDGCYVLRTSDIDTSGRVHLDRAPRISLTRAELAKYRVERGDLLITRTGSIGTVAMFDDDVDAIPGAYLIQYRLAAPLATARYIWHFLKSPKGQLQLLGGAAGVGRPNLNAPTIDAIPIPLPGVEQQEVIVAEIERRLVVVERTAVEIEMQLARATHLRQAILKRAFEGRLVSQDPSDEPASLFLESIRAALAVDNVKPNGSRSRLRVRTKER